MFFRCLDAGTSWQRLTGPAGHRTHPKATVADTLKVAEKDKKTTEKEIEQFRDKLREIQGIKI